MNKINSALQKRRNLKFFGTLVLVVCLFILSFVISKVFLNKEKEEQQIIIGRSSDSISLDPAIATDFESFQVTSNIFENLVTTSNNGTKILPGLAESWEISEDGLTLVFTLREDIYFHDNTPLDAEAVVFNFKRWMDKHSPYHIGEFIYWNQSFGGDPEIIKSITAISKYKVEIVLYEPYTPILSVLALPAFGIGSPTAIIKYNEDFRNHPVGTGPYKLSSWNQDGEIVLLRNDDYRNKDISISKVIFKTFSDEEDYVQMLKDGELHIVNQISGTDVELMENMDEIDVYFLPFLNISYLSINHKKSIFHNRMVREAIAKVINRDEMIRKAYDVLSRPAYSFVPPTLPGYNEGFKSVAYDIDGAKELLAKAGYLNGFSINLWVMKQPRNYYPSPEKVAMYLKQQMALIGIEVEIVTIEWDEYIDYVRIGEHDMALVGWQGDYADPDNFLFTMFYSANTHEGTVLNYSFYSNEEVDESLRQARRVADPEFRSFIYREIQETLLEDIASIPLAHTMMALGVNENVKGFIPNISGTLNIYKMEVETDDQ